MTLDVGELRDRLAARNLRRLAIDGRGGSGKSTLARALAELWPGLAVVEMDDFYRPLAERARDHDSYAASLDRERLLNGVLAPVVAGRGGRYQRYDWVEDRLREWHQLPAGAAVLVEGVYSISEPLRGCFEFTIWVECPYEVRLRRGVERDGEGMRSVWVEQWMPDEDRYVEAERPQEHANLVLDGSGAAGDGVVFEVLADREL